MNTHLKHLQAHLEAITGIQSISSELTSESVVKEVRNKVIEIFTKCSPEEREAYLTYLRAQKVHQKLYGTSIHPQNPLNHLQGILSINGSSGMGHHISISLKDLEDAHANLLVEEMLNDDVSKK